MVMRSFDLTALQIQYSYLNNSSVLPLIPSASLQHETADRMPAPASEMFH